VLRSEADWRAIFFVNLPVGLVTLARVPRSPRRDVPLDLAGQLTAVVALATLAFGVIEGGASGFARPAVVSSLVLAAVAAAAFGAAEARGAQPMVPLRLLRSRVVAAS
jgi:DHA2 family methylenomycin A resistance protein-like MFS transporter